MKIEPRPVAEGGFILRRPCIVSAGIEGITDDIEYGPLDLPVLAALLDGRTLTAVFEGYVETSGSDRSARLGRSLMMALTILAEHDLIEVESTP